jgi:hypothetical protein
MNSNQKLHKQSNQSSAQADLLDGKSLKTLLQKEIKDLQEQIRDRRAYLNEQEELIAQALDEGNQQLKAKRVGIEEVQLEKEDLLRQIIESKQTAAEAAKEAEDAVEKTAQLKIAYEVRATQLKGSLKELQQAIDENTKTLQRISVDTEIRLRNAEEKEKALDERARILDQQTKDLNDAKRKFDSDKSLYFAT